MEPPAQIEEREQWIEQSIRLERLDAKSNEIVSFSNRSCEWVKMQTQSHLQEQLLGVLHDSRAAYIVYM